MEYNIEQIKSNKSLSAIYENLTGWQLKQNAGNCPFHDSKRKTTFSIKDDNFFKCFSCGASGSVIDFVMKYDHKSFPDACQYLGGEMLPDKQRPPKAQKKQSITAPLPELSETTKQIYKSFFNLLTLTDAGKSYLSGRGLNDTIIEQYKIRSIDNPETVFKSLIAEYSLDQLQKAGLIKIGKDNKHHFIFYLPCLIFTIFEDSQPVYFNSRNFTGDHDRRFLKLAGLTQRYFSGDLSADKIYIFEGLIDALSFQQLTMINNFIVLSGLNNRKYSEIYNKYKDKIIVAIFDSDKAGEKAKKEISDKIGHQIPCLKFEQFKQSLGVKSSCKDINDILRIKELIAGNPAVFKALLTSLSESCKESFEERAAIMEFDGNQTKAEAEKNALLCLLGEL